MTLKYPSYSPYLAAIGLFLPLIIFLFLAAKSDILRDSGPAPPIGKPRCFSLARTQMAWWFFIILGSYLYVWLATRDYNILTTGVLVLVGVSAVTGLGAVVVDSSKFADATNLKDQQDSLRKAAASLDAEIKRSPAPANMEELKAKLEQNQKQLDEVEAKVARMPGPESFASRGFWFDILCDDYGISFHRFQMTVWTLMLGLVFIVQVCKDFAMPEFDSTILGLMGISSGTYLGFKLPGPSK